MLDMESSTLNMLLETKLNAQQLFTCSMILHL